MKRIISILLLVALNVGLICGCQEKSNIKKGDPILATFTAMDIAGNAIDQQVLTDHKLTMVNIWATFCSPCIQEMPDLGQLHTAYGDDFQVIGIVIDAADQNLQPIPEELAEAKSIIQSTGANYLHLLPSASLINAILADVSSVPTTIFVDENGNQIGDIYIGSKTKAQWKAIIDTLLECI